jgi:CPA2 family monovalent cation:H+ antiporter-2
MGKRIARYSANAQAIRSVSTCGNRETYMVQIIIHTIIITAIILLSSKFVLPLVENYRFGDQLLLITIIIIAPFLWALALRRVAVKKSKYYLRKRKYR